MGALDRSRTFGTVCGDLEGRVYEQDGCFYRGDGTLWVSAAPEADVEEDAAPTPVPKPASRRGKATHPDVTTDTQLDAQLGAV